MTFSATDKQKEAEREAAMRRAVYPKWVASGRMKQAEAEMRIACMQSIAEDYRDRAKQEQGGGENGRSIGLHDAR